MKTRKGFISNSSSTCYIIALRKNFDLPPLLVNRKFDNKYAGSQEVLAAFQCLLKEREVWHNSFYGTYALVKILQEAEEKNNPNIKFLIELPEDSGYGAIVNVIHGKRGDKLKEILETPLKKILKSTSEVEYENT